MRRILTALVVSLLGLPATAHGDSTPAADFTLTFGTIQPSTPALAHLHIVFKNPADPSARPDPQRTVTVELPAGSRIDGTVVATCSVPDPVLLALGAAGCPDDSRIGSGTLTLRTNGGPGLDPFVDDVVLFNGGSNVVELFTPRGSPANDSVAHRDIKPPATLFEATSPQPGGPPDFESSVSDIDYRFDRARGMIVTPPACPEDGRWHSRLTFTTDSNAYTVDSATPCAKAAASRSKCVSRRVVRVHLARPARVTVLRDAKLVSRFRRPRTIIPVDLRGLPRGTYKITLLIREAGTTRRVNRVFRTCGR
jgi:hypothetical protein